MTKLAAIQMVSGEDLETNLSVAANLIRQAVQDGAKLVVLPENFAYMGMQERDRLGVAERFGQGPIQGFLADSAASHRIWLVAGTIPITHNDDERVRAACLVYDPDGAIAGRYDKIHLFDVDIPGSSENYRESECTEPGADCVVLETAVGRLGLAVCYDIRFPELFRAMSDQSVDLIALPAAFTAATGRAHWETLVRARAVENLSCVIAAAQGGKHVNGRETHGDTMIVDSWGTIVGRLARGAGVVAADFDIEAQTKLRHLFPVLEHQRYRTPFTR